MEGAYRSLLSSETQWNGDQVIGLRGPLLPPGLTPIRLLRGAAGPVQMPSSALRAAPRSFQLAGRGARGQLARGSGGAGVGPRLIRAACSLMAPVP